MSVTQKQEEAKQMIAKLNFDDKAGPQYDDEDEDNDIMSHLNYRKLQKIKEDFMKCEEEGLSLEQFIKVMLIHLPETRDKVGLVKNLIELFRQIDVNNDQSLEWDEFTGHIIELGMVRKDRTFIDAIKNYFASDILDDKKHDTEVENMVYFDKLNHLLVMERDSNKFKVYDTKTGKCIIPQSLPGGGETLSIVQGGAVIAAEYIEMGNTKLVATTSNNNSIYFWDPANNYREMGSLNTSEIQMCIRWCGSGDNYNVNKLFTGGCDFIVHAWDV